MQIGCIRPGKPRRKLHPRLFICEPIESRLFLSNSPLTAIPALASDPGAPCTIYLDFHGETAQSWGGMTVPATPAYDLDGDPTTFNPQELTNVQQIWARVSEAYSAFNVNVTTVDPGNWNLTGQSVNNGQLREVIGGNGSWSGMVQGGIAYIGSYFTAGLPNTVYVFSTNLGGSPQYVGDDAVHEAGHAFGLQHQSLYNGTTKVNEYNPGTAYTAPFMGNPLSPGMRALWWYGQSSLGYNVIQDDMAALASAPNGFGYRPLTVGQSAATATSLVESGPSLNVSGIIESTSQQDYYSFSVFTSGAVSFSVNPAPYGPMLHARLEIHDSADNVIATAAASTLSQSIITSLPAGDYFLVVKSFGQYGDVGQYTVSGQLSTGPAAVVGRYIFYNNSTFDGNNPAPNRADDNSIAPDKQALLPGTPAQFANITSFWQGINGILVDVANLPAMPAVSDFSFLVGNTTDLTYWSAAPQPTGFRVRAGAGASGSTRIEFTWAAGSIKNEWLQITVNADSDTGLASPDVFYFGNLIGYSGATTLGAIFIVTPADVASAQQDPHGFLNPASITDPNDFNRDGRVDASDQIIAKDQATAEAVLVRLGMSTILLPARTSITAATVGVSASPGIAPATNNSRDTDSGKSRRHARRLISKLPSDLVA